MISAGGPDPLEEGGAAFCKLGVWAPGAYTAYQ